MISVSMPRQRPLAWVSAQEVHPLGAVGHHHAAGQVQAAGLAGDLLELAVEPDGVGLELGDVGVAVQGVEAAGGVPGRARRSAPSARSASRRSSRPWRGGRAPSSRPRRRRSPRRAPASASRPPYSPTSASTRRRARVGQPLDDVEMVAAAARSSATCRRRGRSRCWRSASSGARTPAARRRRPRRGPARRAAARAAPGSRRRPRPGRGAGRALSSGRSSGRRSCSAADREHAPRCARGTSGVSRLSAQTWRATRCAAGGMAGERGRGPATSRGGGVDARRRSSR